MLNTGTELSNQNNKITPKLLVFLLIRICKSLGKTTGSLTGN